MPGPCKMLEVRRYDLKGNRRGGNVALVAFVCRVGVGRSGLSHRIEVRAAGAQRARDIPILSRADNAGRRRDALVLALLWAVFLSQAVAAFTYIFSEARRSGRHKGRGVHEPRCSTGYETGDGMESDPKRFIPRHVRDFALFSALALVTGGFGALFLGAVLLNYMNFYVGSSSPPRRIPIWTLFLAWQPYAIVRVVGYIFVATALDRDVFRRGDALPREVAKRQDLRGDGAWRSCFLI